MIGPKRNCVKCGHGCHCYATDCQECHNDVCTKCECKEVQDTDAKDWSKYLK